MQKLLLLLVLPLTLAAAPAPPSDSVSLEDLLDAGAAWVQENIDPNVLGALGQVDQDQAQRVFRALEQQFQGEYVVDLAALKQAATNLVPVLERDETTRPYAAWLRTRLDYFEVADEFRLSITPPPGTTNVAPRINPPADFQQKAWQKQLEKRPLPKGAATYASRLKQVFTAQRVPTQLVWLAEVESSFDPSARSPAGAAGLFQLMPRTAKSLGLALTPQDERLQPEKNAAAAARYLRYLHGQFRDWPLALAAYNAGEGRVRALVGREKTSSFARIAARLPAETQLYVPKVSATIQRREGITLAALPAPGE